MWCNGEWHRECSIRCNFDFWNGIRTVLAEAVTPLSDVRVRMPINNMIVMWWMEAINILCWFFLLHIRSTVLQDPWCNSIPRNDLFISLTTCRMSGRDVLTAMAFSFSKVKHHFTVQGPSSMDLLAFELCTVQWLVGSCQFSNVQLQRWRLIFLNKKHDWTLKMKITF